MIGDFDFDEWIVTLSPTMKVMLEAYKDAIVEECNKDMKERLELRYLEGRDFAYENLKDQAKRDADSELVKITKGKDSVIKGLSTQIKNLKDQLNNKKEMAK